MAKHIDLTGQVALVTGGGAGIGRGIAVALAEAGADVVIADVDPDRSADAVAAVERCGRRGLAVQTNAMDVNEVGRAVVTTERELGRLDILVNNAGGVTGRPLLEQSERSWRRHIDLNLVSTISATAHAAQVMIRGGHGGSIVNVASIEGTRAAPRYAVYAACKAGVLSFTRTMALELAEHRIRVNAITPDHTRSPGIYGITSGVVDESTLVRPPALAEAVTRYVPLGYEGVPSECGDAVVFLCSPLASYITGVTLPVDGGAWAASGWMRAKDGSGYALYEGTEGI